MPELSIQEVKQYLQDVKNRGPDETGSSFEVWQSVVASAKTPRPDLPRAHEQRARHLQLQTNSIGSGAFPRRSDRLPTGLREAKKPRRG